MQMSCWLTAAGLTRLQASRRDVAVQHPRKPIKNLVSWPSSRCPHSSDEPPAETIRPVEAPCWRESTHHLGNNPSLLATEREQRGKTPPSLTLGGKNRFFSDTSRLWWKNKKKKQLRAPPAQGWSDAAEQTNLPFHADLPLRSSPHVLGFKVESVQLLKVAGKRKQTICRLTAAIFRGSHPWRSWFCGGIKKLLPLLSNTLFIHRRSSWSKSRANWKNTMENCSESPNKAADV